MPSRGHSRVSSDGDENGERRHHVRKVICTRLKPGDPLPTSEPKRYLRQSGYVLLRWRVGDNRYVETYEHRAVMGLPYGHVHHRNGKRDDNRPENLEVLDAREHHQHHAKGWQKFDRDEAAALYRSGWNTLMLAEFYSVDTSNLSRGLRKAGVQMRTSTDFKTIPVSPQKVRDLFLAGRGGTFIAKHLGVGTTPVYRVMRALGLRRKPGRVKGR